MTDRKALADVGSERAVLAGLCQWGNDAFVDIDGIVDVNTFTVPNNQMLYKCLEHLFKNGTKKVDQPSIIGASHALNYHESITKEKKDLEYLRSLFNFPIYLENVRTHAMKILNLRVGRMAQDRHQEAYRNLSEINGTEGVDHIIGISENPIFALSNELNAGKEESPETLGEGTRDYLIDLMDNPVENMGVPTPWPIFNKMIGGGIRTGVSLVAARPKVGKSSCAKECGIHAANVLGIPVLMLDTEMKKNDQIHRAISSISKIPLEKIETGQCGQNKKDREAILNAEEKIRSIPFYHKRIGGKDFDEVLSIIRRWIYQVVGFDEDGNTNPHLVIYDYFKLMSDKGLKDIKEYQAIGFQISALTDFCNDYDTPVLAFVQVNRDGITKDTTDIISQSDRLLWLCTSLSIYKRKTADEIANDGTENGNMKLVPLECRFGTPAEEGDHINMEMDGSIATIKELNTQRMAVADAQNNSTGFEVDEDDGEDKSPF